MSTHANIIAKLSNGKWGKIYTQFDGYFGHHWPILTEHYNTQEMVDKLIALGDLSILDKSPECPNGHSYRTPIDGYCVAYGRDRGEEDTEAEITDSQIELMFDLQFYYYVWDGEKWNYNRKKID